jgi:hypothetical protein
MSANRKKDLIYKVGETWQGKVNIKVGYIVGLPGEDSKFVRETVDWFLEESNPVNQLNLNPLRILPQLPALSHTSRSEIDLNYQKYGYNIPDLSKFWQWTKNDGTDIMTFDSAANLCSELTEKIKKRPTMIETFNETGIKNPKEEYFIPLIKKLKELQ